MSWLAVSVAVALTCLAFWGLVHPRSQWRVLQSWSASDTHRAEPGGASYRARRILSGIALLAVASILLSTALPKLIEPRHESAPTLIEVMWGSPEPRLLDRVVGAGATVPEGMVAATIFGYQAIGADGPPVYLLDVPRYSRLGVAVPPGLVGNFPGDGFTAAGSAEILINVLGPLLCIPREVVIEETETTVRIAVYFGLPDAPAGSVPDPEAVDAVPVDADAAAAAAAAACQQDAPIKESLLMPLELSAELGDRSVETATGIAIPRIREPN
ncbi:MAG: hypothetical protein LH471_02700 [Salinibacterium sp.]|nr:hypothetical protein [Salinibacterium sp.]